MDFYTRYEFNPKKDLLGKGGFSKVYRANDTLLERTVALKFFTANASEKYQVLNEIKKVIRFEHPNLCKYYDVAVLSSKNIVGEMERTEVGIMEYLDSGDFKTYLKANPQYLDKLLIDVLKGLSYLHKKGIVHRDLKPQNILIKMVDEEPVAKITDFGISKLISSEDTNSSTLMGTIEYMAPEQFNPKKYGVSGRITTNLDMWSFGLLVYEAICHKPLFGSRSSGTSAEQVMRNILSDSLLAKANELPEKYREIVQRCLVKSAVERVQHAGDLIPLFHKEGAPASGARPYKVPAPVSGLPPAQEEATSILPGGAADTGTQVLGAPENTGEITRVLPDQAATGETTQVFEAGTATEQLHTRVLESSQTGTLSTQVLPSGGGVTGDNTQVMGSFKEKGEEKTQVLQPAAGDETSGVVTQVFRSAPEEKGAEGKGTIPLKKQPEVLQPRKANPETKKPATENRTVKKAVLYSIAPVLLLIGFFVFRAMNGSQEVSAAHHSARKVVSPAPPAFAPPALIDVVGGSFVMGAGGKGEGKDKTLPTVQVNNFSIGKYEVTVHQFRQFIAETRYVTTAEHQGSSSIFGKDGNWKESKGVNWRHATDGSLIDSSNKTIPVVHVSWQDAVKYCEWLSGKTTHKYRLLTEAEWEYAAKGGNRSDDFLYSGSDNIDEVAWYSNNSENGIREIGGKRHNELGIFDMTGNAMEWCNDDWYAKGDNQPGAENSPAGKEKVIRGGAWSLGKKYCGVAIRAGFPQEGRGGSIGFRICRSGS